MAIKPDLLKWVPNDDPSKIIDPGIGKRSTGWLNNEQPAFEYMNWLHNRVDKWLRGLQGHFFDIVVGSATQVANNEATHTISDLNDTVAVGGSHILVLVGQHNLTADIILNNNDLIIVCENGLAQIHLNTFRFVLNGLAVWGRLRIAGNALEVNGGISVVQALGPDINSVIAGSGATVITHEGLRTGGTNGGIIVPHAAIGGDLNVGGTMTAGIVPIARIQRITAKADASGGFASVNLGDLVVGDIVWFTFYGYLSIGASVDAYAEYTIGKTGGTGAVQFGNGLINIAHAVYCKSVVPDTEVMLSGFAEVTTAGTITFGVISVARVGTNPTNITVGAGHIHAIVLRSQ